MGDSTCSVPECGKPRRKREWCHTHYEYWRRHGELYVPPTPDQRFDRFIDKSGECWLWTGTKIPPSGYGTFSVNGSKVIAHRYSYERWKGPIPEGLQVDHLCFNPPCVRPDHLEAVTPAVNTIRSTSRVTHCPRGHAYSGTNLIQRGNARTCRTCTNERQRERKLRRREAA